MFTNIFSTYIHQAKSTTDVGAHIDLCEVKHQQKMVLMEYKNIVGLDNLLKLQRPEETSVGSKAHLSFSNSIRQSTKRYCLPIQTLLHLKVKVY